MVNFSSLEGTTQESRDFSHEMFKNTMYYDYKGSKKVNVYKKRMIEKYLGELAWNELMKDPMELSQKFKSDAMWGNAHLKHLIDRKPQHPDTIFFTFQFSPAAEKLIEFCVEAEKSPLYEKAVLLLFDLFELRRDAYDRFHNEEEYLATMNQTADYKKMMLDYVGEEAYVHEVQEQFGYFTPSEFTSFILDTLGNEAKIVESRHFLQKGYTVALADKVRIMDQDGNVVPLPDSTCLIVIEK